LLGKQKSAAANNGRKTPGGEVDSSDPAKISEDRTGESPTKQEKC